MAASDNSCSGLAAMVVLPYLNHRRSVPRSNACDANTYKARAMGSTVSSNAILCSHIASTRSVSGLASVTPSLCSTVLGKGFHCLCEVEFAARGRDTFSSDASKANGLPNEKLDRLKRISHCELGEVGVGTH